jgi:hypothetical protein
MKFILEIEKIIFKIIQKKKKKLLNFLEYFNIYKSTSSS